MWRTFFLLKNGKFQLIPSSLLRNISSIRASARKLSVTSAGKLHFPRHCIMPFGSSLYAGRVPRVVTVFAITATIILCIALAVGLTRNGGDGASGLDSNNDPAPSQGPHTRGPQESPTPGPKVSKRPRPLPSQTRTPSDLGGNDDGCGNESDQCSFVDTFSAHNKTRWTVSDKYANGPAFGVWWDKSHVQFNYSEGLRLSLSPQPQFEKPYAAGQVKSNGWFEYGCFEASIKPKSQPG